VQVYTNLGQDLMVFTLSTLMTLDLSKSDVICKQMVEGGQCSKEDKTQVLISIVDGKITKVVLVILTVIFGLAWIKYIVCQNQGKMF
jgi:type IV secretory pathway VirB2 component (pilin)